LTQIKKQRISIRFIREIRG